MTSPADPPALRAVLGCRPCPACRRPIKVREGVAVGDVLHQCDKVRIEVAAFGGAGPPAVRQVQR